MNSVSIIIPAFNEEKRLPATLSKVAGYLQGKAFQFCELIVVDDGSRDATAALVDQFTSQFPCTRLLKNPGNQGKGYSVRHGMLNARGEWILFSDADLSTPIEELDTLVAAAGKASAEVAIGSRALDRSLVSVPQPMMREYSGRFFNKVMRLATGLPFCDTQCGFKLFSARAAKEVFARQRLNGFGFDVEALFIARLLGIPCVEVPVRWADVAGTKVSLRSGLNGFADLYRIRRNRSLGGYK